MPLTDMRDNAAALALRGFRVFRLIPNGATPAFEGWQGEASQDPDIIRKLWTDPFGEAAHYNPGIATGRGVVALDIDTKNGKRGDETYARLALLHDLDENTYTQRTRSGGAHMLFRVDPETVVKNSVEALGPGIDVRGEGGYVVGAGAVTPKGAYSVARDGPITALPESLLQDLRRPAERPREHSGPTPGLAFDLPRNIERARNWLTDDAPLSIESAGGDHAAYVVAAKLLDFGLSENTVFDLMLDWNAEKAAPPWSAEEIETKIGNASRYRQNPVGNDAAPIVEFDPVEIHETGASVRPESLGGAPSNRWEPLDIAALKWNPNAPYIVRGLLSPGMVGFVSGMPNAGKSPFVLDLAAHIAKGAAWRGKKVRQGAVLYVATEGMAGLQNRLEAVRRQHFANDSISSLGVLRGDFDFRQSPRDAEGVVHAGKALEHRCGLPVSLLIVDTMSHTLGGGDDSNPEHIRAWLKNIKRIAAKLNCGALVVHHPTKDGASTYRGSSIIAFDTDLLVWIEQDKNGVREVTTPRTKDWAQIEPVHFRVEVVDLGADGEGDSVTGVRLKWAAAADFEPVEARLSALEEGTFSIVCGLASGRENEWVSSAEIGARMAAEKLTDASTEASLMATVRRVLGALSEQGRVEKREGRAPLWRPKLTLRTCEH